MVEWSTVDLPGRSVSDSGEQCWLSASDSVGGKRG